MPRPLRTSASRSCTIGIRRGSCQRRRPSASSRFSAPHSGRRMGGLLFRDWPMHRREPLRFLGAVALELLISPLSRTAAIGLTAPAAILAQPLYVAAQDHQVRLTLHSSSQPGARLVQVLLPDTIRAG